MKPTIRDLIAFPFSILMFMFGFIAISIGGQWTATQMVATFKKSITNK